MRTFRTIRDFAGLLFLALIFCGPSRAQAVSSSMPEADEAPAGASAPPEKHVVNDPNYLLQPDDVIEVTVFREPDLTTDGMVRKDGCFDMKLIGAVKVAGSTLDQASEMIRAALAKDYLVNPRINLGIVDYAKKKVNVLGQVRNPGVYLFPPRGPLLLSDAIALAGGFVPGADTAHVEVERTGGHGVETIEVDASGGGVFALKPDDAISVTVLPRHEFTVLGQVARPGTYDMPDDRPVYLTDAIAVAGGFTRIANPSRVLLKRSEKGRETVLSLNAKAMENSPDTQRLQIQNEDTITVTESMF